ncbi:MAG: DnaJ domain-containing protein [Desulfofustis sp.]|nr:DnaJ domain-containing protein [Desulfofustis sp.]
MKTDHKELIGRLIKAYRSSSTESLIDLISGADGMLEACRTLLNKRDIEAPDLKGWLRHRCEQVSIDEQAFLLEIRTITELFSPHTGDDDPYQVLGLTAEASPEQIKRAYRKLSLRYHPDTAAEQSRTEPDQFIKITRAYQTLLGNNTEPVQPIQKKTTNNIWRQKKQPTRHSPQRKKVFIWTLGLLILLLVVSFFAATNYRKKTMIAGLQHSRGAFIPPPAKTVVAAIPKTTSEVIIEQPTLKQEYSSKIQSAPVIDRNTSSRPLPTTQEEPILAQKNVEKIINSSPKSKPAIKQLQANQEVVKDSQVTSEFKATQQPGNQLPSIIARPVKVTEPAPPEETKQRTSKAEVTDIAATQSSNPLPTVPIAKPEVLRAPVPADKPDTTQNNLSVDKSPFVTKDSSVELSAEASAQAETSAKEVDSERTEAVPIDQRLQTFFDSYLSAYNERNILEFSRFFAVDAVENSKPFATMVQTYLELFQKTDSAVLQIKDLDWNKTSNQIEVTGRFNVNLHYRTGDRVSGTGPITFLLQENGNSFQVSSLEYHFVH